MKRSAKSTPAQVRHHPKHGPEQRDLGTRGTFWPGGWAWLACGLLVAAAGTLAVLEFAYWNKVPPAMVGKWQVEEGSAFGGSFEFARVGTLEARLKSQGRDFNVKSRVTVRDKTLLITSQNALTGREELREWAILELTASSLVLELENGDVVRTVRVP